MLNINENEYVDDDGDDAKRYRKRKYFNTKRGKQVNNLCITFIAFTI